MMMPVLFGLILLAILGWRYMSKRAIKKAKAASCTPGGSACPTCGNEVRDGMKFCMHCGASIGKENGG